MPSRTLTRTAALAAGWTLAAVVAVGGGLLAVGEVGDGIVANQAEPMSHQEIVDRLAVPASADNGKGSVPTDSTQVFGSDGGTVLAGCVGGNAFVRSATPAPGYSVDDEVEAESEGRVKVEFKKGKAEVEVTIDCGTGVPVSTIAQDDDD